MRNIIITGGSGGVAKGVLELLQGEREYILHSPNRSELDVSNEAKVNSYFSSHTCDILINNASCIHPQTIRESDTSLWREDLEANLLGTYLCSHYALVANPRVRIINIGSSSAYTITGTWSAYCASKAGVLSLTETMIEEGIDAYCLNIGRVATPMRLRLRGEEDPNTLLTPLEVANEVLEIIKGNRMNTRIYRFRK